MVYELMTLTRLRGDVFFLHGSNNCKSIPCKYVVLRRKGLLKDRDQKIVGSAILISWIQEEENTSLLLKWYMRRHGLSMV